MKARKANTKSKFYILRSFRFARKRMGGAWIKTRFRGWISYQTYVYYKGYGFDPIALIAEEEGKITWKAEGITNRTSE